MPIKVECPGCGKTIRAPEKYAGRNANCPGCGAPVSIPGDGFEDLVGAAMAEPPPVPKTQATKPCPACAEEILAAARKCKHCGENLEQESPKPRAVVTEATSKKWKGLQLVGLAMTFLGSPCVLVVGGLALGEPSKSNEAAGLLLFASVICLAIGGVMVTIYARLMAWWHHG